MSRRRWLVAYDIADDGRLRRVHSVVRSHGEPLQYSVFLCDLSTRELFGLKMELRDIVHHRADRVIFIDLGDAAGSGPAMDYLGQRPPWPTTGESVII